MEGSYFSNPNGSAAVADKYKLVWSFLMTFI
jgi:hypothetical protein